MSDLTNWRIEQVRRICTNSIKVDDAKTSNGFTDRQWLAQSVLNILDGLIDSGQPS